MDFFQAQELARRNTRLLAIYFLLAVAAIAVAVHLAVSASLMWSSTAPLLDSWWRWDVLFGSLSGTSLLIMGGSLYKVSSLAAGGGAAVAEELGGRQVDPNSRDPMERRLLNVVEEMSIASGMPVPPVYVLDQDEGINAFAAGTKPRQAGVAVTRGCLEQLDRDELQGVIGHEFSHVLNGDMRMNLRLIGILHGILLLALIGRGMLRGSTHSRNRNSGGGALLGLAFLVIGYIGVFFGRLIKAGISRQREYLADASAVQFTRNPSGIAGALKKIGGLSEGSRVAHPRAEEASHMFFGNALELSLFTRLLATHPPLEERIRRLQPGFTPVESKAAAAVAAAPEGAMGFAGGQGSPAPEQFSAAVGQVSDAHVEYARLLLARIPDELEEDCRRADGVEAVAYALFIDPEADLAGRQLREVERRRGADLARRTREHADWLHRTGPEVRLPVADLAQAGLRELDEERRALLTAVVDALIQADQRISLGEYAQRRILLTWLRPEEARLDNKSPDVPRLRRDIRVLLSFLAYAGAQSQDNADGAYAAAAERAPVDNLEPVLARDQLQLKDLDQSLSRLAALKPRFRKGLVEACAAAIVHDQRIRPAEGELLRAVCDALDCPMPPLLPGQFKFMAGGMTD
jgi:Zn-dependent protease with chaperone function